VGPTLDDDDDDNDDDNDNDDGKPAAKPVAKKCRALRPSDSASERPLESGPPVPEGHVPPVAAMPPEAARAAAPKRGHPAGSGKTSSPRKGAKKVQSKSGRSQERDDEEPCIPLEKGNQKGGARKKYKHPQQFEGQLFESMTERDMDHIMSD